MAEQMSDRYLCKAKRTDYNEWVEGYLVKFGSTYWICTGRHGENRSFINEYGIEVYPFEKYVIDPETVCHYTGLKDKNGKMIWENDIVRCNYDNYGDKGIYEGKVFFREDTCMFLVSDGKSTDYEWWNEEKEVIGNIFDNKELLEVAE